MTDSTNPIDAESSARQFGPREVARALTLATVVSLAVGVLLVQMLIGDARPKPVEIQTPSAGTDDAANSQPQEAAIVVLRPDPPATSASGSGFSTPAEGFDTAQRTGESLRE